MAALAMISSPYHIEGLHPREAEIAVYAALGYSNPEIAKKAGITNQTVKNHLRNAFRVLRISKREDLEPIVYAQVPEVREEMRRLGRAPNPFIPSANERKPQAIETGEKSVANKKESEGLS